MKPFGSYGGNDLALNDVDYGPVELDHTQAVKTIALAIQSLDFDADVSLPELLFERQLKVLNPLVSATPVALIKWAAQFLEEVNHD